MFCPFCKAEYRAGIVRCSDCSFPLVEGIPRDDSDPNFMVLLWNGERLPFLEAVCAELDRAQIPVATPRLEVLLRDPADRYHLKHLKTFPYILGVFKRDFVAARKILESVAKNTFPPIYIPPVGAYPQPVDERVTSIRWGKSKASLDATVPICSSSDLRYVEFVEASLGGVDIPFRRVVLEAGAYEIQVRPGEEVAGRQILHEISLGVSPQADLARKEEGFLEDEPVRSYFLAWLIPTVYYFIWIFVFAALPDGRSDTRFTHMIGALLVFTTLLNWLGMFWMMDQAMRYEVHPFRYCVASLIPLACVWYYVERYQARKGPQRLPIAARIRKQQPPLLDLASRAVHSVCPYN